MNHDQLKRANELKNEIENLEKRLNIWNTSISISSINIAHRNIHNGVSTENLDNSFIDFKVLKVLTIEAIQTRLLELKNEFEKL